MPQEMQSSLPGVVQYNPNLDLYEAAFVEGGTEFNCSSKPPKTVNTKR